MGAVLLEAQLRPVAHVRAGVHGPQLQAALEAAEASGAPPLAPPPPSIETLLASTGERGGQMVASILKMSSHERAIVCAGASSDPLVVWFALLEPEVRQAMVKTMEMALRAAVAQGGL